MSPSEIVRELVGDEWVTKVGQGGGGGGSQPGAARWLGPCKIGAFDGQYISSSQDFGGGNYTFTINSEETGAIAWNAGEAAIQAALEALPSIGAGHVIVNCAATSLADGDAAITFKDALATDLLTADVSALTGGTPSLSVAGAGAWVVEMYTPAVGDIIEDFMHAVREAFDADDSPLLFYTDDADDPTGAPPIWAMPTSSQGIDGLDLAVPDDFSNFTGNGAGAGAGDAKSRPTALSALIAQWSASAADATVNLYSNLPAVALNAVPIYSAVDQIVAAPTQGEVWIWIKVSTPAAMDD